MEPKTMGPFLAALRKASGMTQKELAEKLNVSDKSVSRWERDDGAPDLSLIPVIAEIFGVTCDELLRGERRAEVPSAEPTPKGEKQCRRILAAGLARYRSRTFIAMGISALGLIAAMIGDLAFLRAYAGFFAGTVFFLASLVCQGIFLNGAFLSVEDDCLEQAGIVEFRTRVVGLAKWAWGLTLVLFAATLPLVIYVDDAYWGLSGGRWLQAGLSYAAVVLALWGIVCWFATGRLLKKGVIAMSGEDIRKYRHNRRLLLRTVAAVLAAALCTLLVQSLVNNRFGVWDIAGGMEFQDYGSFTAYMEQPVDGELGYASVPDAEVGSEEWEDAYLEEVVLPDGKTACTFYWRNSAVVQYRTAATEDGLPITAVTDAHYQRAKAIVELYNGAFALVYLLEILGAGACYMRKRMK